MSCAFLKPFWVDNVYFPPRKHENINVFWSSNWFFCLLSFHRFGRGKFERHLITHRSCRKISPWNVSTRYRWPFKHSARKAHINSISWVIRGSKRSSRNALPHSQLPIFFVLEINKLLYQRRLFRLSFVTFGFLRWQKHANSMGCCSPRIVVPSFFRNLSSLLGQHFSLRISQPLEAIWLPFLGGLIRR